MPVDEGVAIGFVRKGGGYFRTGDGVGHEILLGAAGVANARIGGGGLIVAVAVGEGFGAVADGAQSAGAVVRPDGGSAAEGVSAGTACQGAGSGGYKTTPGTR